MKTAAILLFFFIVDMSANAGSPFIYGAGKAINLENRIENKNGVQYISGSLDPSSVAVNAPAGSLYSSTSGTLYVKQDAGSSTNWLPLGIATPGSLTTINGQSGPAVSIVAGTVGTDFAISTAANVITLNLPSASASNRGALASADWSTFNGKQPLITGSATTIDTETLTSSMAMVTDGSGKVAVSSVVSATELDALDNIGGNIQTLLNGKEDSLGFTPEDVANKDTDGTLAANSDTKYASQKAVKTYVTASIAAINTGLLSLNTLTAATQTFATGSTGTAPAFVSATSTHTLNIPLASGAGVTSGTISKASYDAFVAKQDALVNSAGLAAALNDETGTGLAVFSASPALTGSPTAPTQSSGDNSTKIATTAYVDSAIVTSTVDPVYCATISTSGGVSNERPGGFINGNCTNAAPNVCTFDTSFFTSYTDCWANNTGGNFWWCQTNNSSTTSVSISCFDYNGSAQATSANKKLCCRGH